MAGIYELLPAQKLRLKRALGRLNKDQVLNLHNTIYESEDQSVSLTKTQLVTSFMSSYEKDLREGHPPPYSVANIELHAITTKPSTIQWSAFILTPLHGVQSVSEPQQFCKNFTTFLNDLCRFEMADMIYNGGHWLCVNLEGGASSTYIIRTPPSHSVLIAGAKKAHLPLLMEALCMALQCSEWHPAELSGRSPQSLIDRLLGQPAQSSRQEVNPLLSLRHKRKCSQAAPVDQLRAMADSVFGTEAPKLQRYSFIVTSEETQCTIKLTGSNILEGMKECIKQGLVTLPLPESVSDMPTTTSNIKRIDS